MKESEVRNTTMTAMTRLFTLLLLFCYLAQITQSADEALWKPESGTLEEWLQCNGMPRDMCLRHKEKFGRFQQMFSKTSSTQSQGVIPTSNGTATDCIMLTEDQLDSIMAGMETNQQNTIKEQRRRQKRNVINFVKEPSSKWSMPIIYKFDGSHNDAQRTIIRNSFQHWMDNTCARFTEVPNAVQVSGNHILLTGQTYSCASYVGKTNFSPQPIYLANNCLPWFGIPVHEIGHALGLWHEQSRTDRDSWVDIFSQNVDSANLYNYNIATNSTSLGVPYDYGSVMHYSSVEFSGNGQATMRAKESLYQNNMGQRVGLSFSDIKKINLAYCQNICQRGTDQPCTHGGYQDPKNCQRCLCPDGFSGSFCQSVAPSKNAVCGGELTMTAGSQLVVQSPGFDNPKYYQARQECSWWIKAPAGQQIQLRFDGEFGVYCVPNQGNACFHWVEVKYKADLGLQGPRFCCRSRPTATITSASNEMLIVFKSNFTTNLSPLPDQRGFRAILTVTAPPTTTTLPTTRTSSSLRTTPAARPTPGSSTLFQCSFEKNESPDQLCGMTQDKSDQFDWTVFSGATPSDPTGPNSALDQQYYIYIEASDPRRLNDEARLWFPAISSYYGNACIDFYYHMFGFHVNTLKVIQYTGSSSASIIWSRSRDMNNQWYHGLVTVNLQATTRLQIIASRGAEYSGDIALDKIQITRGACQ